jgi:hypothetical protein
MPELVERRKTQYKSAPPISNERIKKAQQQTRNRRNKERATMIATASAPTPLPSRGRSRPKNAAELAALAAEKEAKAEAKAAKRALSPAGIAETRKALLGAEKAAKDKALQDEYESLINKVRLGALTKYKAFDLTVDALGRPDASTERRIRDWAKVIIEERDREKLAAARVIEAAKIRSGTGTVDGKTLRELTELAISVGLNPDKIRKFLEPISAVERQYEIAHGKKLGIYDCCYLCGLPCGVFNTRYGRKITDLELFIKGMIQCGWITAKDEEARFRKFLAEHIESIKMAGADDIRIIVTTEHINPVKLTPGLAFLPGTLPQSKLSAEELEIQKAELWPSHVYCNMIKLHDYFKTLESGSKNIFLLKLNPRKIEECVDNIQAGVHGASYTEVKYKDVEKDKEIFSNPVQAILHILGDFFRSPDGGSTGETDEALFARAKERQIASVTAVTTNLVDKLRRYEVLAENTTVFGKAYPRLTKIAQIVFDRAMSIATTTGRQDIVAELPTATLDNIFSVLPPADQEVIKQLRGECLTRLRESLIAEATPQEGILQSCSSAVNMLASPKCPVPHFSQLFSTIKTARKLEELGMQRQFPEIVKTAGVLLEVIDEIISSSEENTPLRFSVEHNPGEEIWIVRDERDEEDPQNFRTQEEASNFARDKNIESAIHDETPEIDDPEFWMRPQLPGGSVVISVPGDGHCAIHATLMQYNTAIPGIVGIGYQYQPTDANGIAFRQYLWNTINALSEEELAPGDINGVNWNTFRLRLRLEDFPDRASLTKADYYTRFITRDYYLTDAEIWIMAQVLNKTIVVFSRGPIQTYTSAGVISSTLPGDLLPQGPDVIYLTISGNHAEAVRTPGYRFPNEPVAPVAGPNEAPLGAPPGAQVAVGGPPGRRGARGPSMNEDLEGLEEIGGGGRSKTSKRSKRNGTRHTKQSKRMGRLLSRKLKRGHLHRSHRRPRPASKAAQRFDQRRR